MMTLASRKSCQGFSLVEVVIAVAVAGLFMIGVTGLLGTGLGVSQTSSRESKASGIMSQVADDIRATPSGGTSPYYGIAVPAASATGSTMTTAPAAAFFVTDTGLQGALGGNPSPNFRVTVGFLPSVAGSQVFKARIMVTWPAQADQSTGSWPSHYSGSLENVISLNPAQNSLIPLTTQ